jgi:putative hemolysin
MDVFIRRVPMMELLIVLGCVAVNAGLAALEVAFVSVSGADLRAYAGDDLRVQRVLRLRKVPERTLSAIQIGITLMGIVAGAAGGAGALEVLGPFLQSQLNLGSAAAEAAAITIVAIPLMSITVVIGELVPKAFALRHPEHVVLVGANWLGLLERIFFPIVSFLAWATRTIVAVLPQPFGRTPEGSIGNGGPRGHYALNLVDLAQRRVRDAMVSWSQTIKADESMPPQSVADLALSSGHTRLPVIRNGEVIGLLHTKELMRFLAAGEMDWRALVRPTVVVGLEDPLLRVLRLLQERRSHLAIVTALDRTPLGIVTIEDILEEVLGDLYDEDDDRAVAGLLASRGKLKGTPSPVRP